MSPLGIWLVSLATSGFVAFATLVGGIVLKAAIERGIQSRFDAELEKIRSAYRQEEEALKAALKARDEQIVALRAGALQGLAARQLELDKRRIIAIGKIWEGVVETGRLKLGAQIAGVLNFEEMTARRGTSEWNKIQQFIDHIVEVSGIKKPREGVYEVEAERPFVSPYSWALFQAYRLILIRPVMMLLAVQARGNTKIIQDASMLDVVREALPEYSDYLAKYPNGTYELVEVLEKKLLSALQHELAGNATDSEHLERAAKILAASSDLASKLGMSQIPADIVPAAAKADPKAERAPG